MIRKKTGKWNGRTAAKAVFAEAGLIIMLLLTACAAPSYERRSNEQSQTETERRSVEQTRTEEVLPYDDTKAQNSGNEESEDHTNPFKADYVEIVNQNQHRSLYISTGQWLDGDGQPRSEAIDQGAYYEVTHGRILGDTCFALSVMDGKGPGDTLRLEDTIYRITGVETWCLENGQNVELEHVSGPDEGYLMLVHNDSNQYYTLIGPNADTKKDILYAGSLYFSRDCLAGVKDPGKDFKEHTMSIGDYLTKINETIGSQLGLCSGGLALWGDFQMDSSGLIISYAEYRLP